MPGSAPAAVGRSPSGDGSARTAQGVSASVGIPCAVRFLASPICQGSRRVPPGDPRRAPLEGSLDRLADGRRNRDSTPGRSRASQRPHRRTEALSSRRSGDCPTRNPVRASPASGIGFCRNYILPARTGPHRSDVNETRGRPVRCMAGLLDGASLTRAVCFEACGRWPSDP